MEIIKKNIKLYKEVLKKIKQYSTIVVYRHTCPDFDASGTQNGLVTWLKDSFPNKKIYMQGKDFYDFTPRLFPAIEEVDETTLGDFLSIVVDTGNTARIDNQNFSLGKEIIKFDHHPAVENYGQINIVNDELASCAELVLDFVYWCKKKYPLSMLACKYFYIGIVGDSGRFLFSSTSMHTFESASVCLDSGFNLQKDVYLPMYEKDPKDLEIQKFILNNYHLSPKGVAYYIFTKDDLTKFSLRPENGKNHMSLFSNIKGINIWVSISEDVSENVYRVSFRSKEIAINKVAVKYRGGGHAQASGGKLLSLDEVEQMIKDLDDLIK